MSGILLKENLRHVYRSQCFVLRLRSKKEGLPKYQKSSGTCKRGFEAVEHAARFCCVTGSEASRIDASDALFDQHRPNFNITRKLQPT